MPKLTFANPVLASKVHYLTSDFKTRNQNRANHNGMDFVGPNGIDDIIACASGQVSFVGYDKLGGYCIFIKTDSYEQRYFHLNKNKIYVKLGDKVTKGDVIATMGKSGNATNYCLHFAIYQNNQYVDPLLFLTNNSSYSLFLSNLKQDFSLPKTASPKKILDHTITISTSKNWRHACVKTIQQYLLSLGFNLGPKRIDGLYGPATKKAVIAYQTKIAKLPNVYCDGIITKQKYTWQSLLKA